MNQELYDRHVQLNQTRWYAEAIVSTIRRPLLVLSVIPKIKVPIKSFARAFQLTEEGTLRTILFGYKITDGIYPALAMAFKIQKRNERKVY